MLTIDLTLINNQIKVHVNGKASHSFSMVDLNWPETQAEVKNFVSNPHEIGANLFRALFKDGSPAWAQFDVLSKQTERTIVLVLESPELDGIAWEYAYNKAKEEYLVEDCAFVRALPESERPANGRLKASYERVPLLFIPANPMVDLSGEPMRTLDEESEWREISRHLIASNAGFDLLKMLPATPDQLQTVMAQFRDGLIVHFSGHGGVDDGKAILLFECENGASNPLDAREFVREIKDKAAIAFLSACQSAVAERTEFSNLVRGLVKAGVPFALGMQFNLPDSFAPNISGKFYNYLTRGHSIPEAVRQARRAVKREHEFFVGMIALYAAHPDEVGVLKWNSSGAQTLSIFHSADVDDLPSPASGLIGRQHELMSVGAKLIESKKPLTVTLHGTGGIGKTALLRQALLRFAPSFELTLAIALDPLPSLESVLGRIERFLGLPSPCSSNTKEREALVRNALTSKHSLLGLDNFETLNHAVESQSQEMFESAKVAKSLYAFFKSLPAAGVTLCVTSREKTHLPGEHIEEIYGMEDAMGGALFYENISTRKDALNEAGLEKLSAIVGGHPLALRLLAPIFEEQAGLSLEQFVEKLQTFLPTASDQWTEEERHASLGACFAFSMDNLPKTEDDGDLQTALTRLSMFVAFFTDFSAVPVIENRMPESFDEFEKIKPKVTSTLHVLWERGLLERATIALPNENFYLYRLHPMVGAFVKEQLTDVETVKKNYWRSMMNLLIMAQDEIDQDPLWAQIARAAIPDLIIAANRENDEKAARMQFGVGKLLGHFCIYDDALHLLELSHSTFDRLGMRTAEAVSLGEMADIYLARGNLDKVLELRKQELAIVKETGDKREEGLALYGIAHTYQKRGNFDDAIELVKEALEIFEGLGDLQCKSTILHEMAGIYYYRDDWDSAMRLFNQSLDIDERLGHLEGKSTTLHGMASIYVERGDLDTAMKLGQQALEIDKDLGDLRGTVGALRLMGQIYAAQKNYQESLTRLLDAIDVAIRIGANMEVHNIVQNLNILQSMMGFEKFESLCHELTGQPVPEWLARLQQEEPPTAEEFIYGAIRSALEKRPEAEEYFKYAQGLVAASGVSAELRELGKVLQRVMLGGKNVDLSSLPRKWAEMVKKELHG